MCSNNVWSLVCYTGWTDVDARVLCRELGHPPVAGTRIVKISLYCCYGRFKSLWCSIYARTKPKYTINLNWHELRVASLTACARSLSQLYV